MEEKTKETSDLNSLKVMNIIPRKTEEETLEKREGGHTPYIGGPVFVAFYLLLFSFFFLHFGGDCGLRVNEHARLGTSKQTKTRGRKFKYA